MKILLISNSFPPARNSGAVQLRDLTLEAVRQGHEITVIVPDQAQVKPWSLEQFSGAEVLRLKVPCFRSVGYAGRALGEAIMPLAMLWRLHQSPLAKTRWDGVIWYSPSIFHGLLASVIKKKSKCYSYLIIRDIFPEWALDLNLMKRGLAYKFFSAVASYQYSVADVIGIQTEGNSRYFKHWLDVTGRKLEILPNWLGPLVLKKSSIQISETTLFGRKVFIYAGNMGVAQNLDPFLALAQRFIKRTDIGFLWVGRGSEVERLRMAASSQGLDNMLFADEIDPDEISDLYAQCIAGIVALDPRHKSHNIPGKFLSYIQNGLPVLANVNASNDLVELIKSNALGQVCETNDIDDLYDKTNALLLQIEGDSCISDRCRLFFKRKFSVDKTLRQVVAALTGDKI